MAEDSPPAADRDPSRYALTRTLAVALLAARETGRYRWSRGA